MKKLLIIGLLLLTGCASSFGTYMKDRGNDCLDMVKLSGGFKLGAHADVQATDLFHMGAGAGIGITYGLYGREFDGGTEIDINFPVMQIMGLSSDYKPDFGIPCYLVTHLHEERGSFCAKMNEGDACFISPLIAGKYISKKNEYKKPFYRLFDIETGATAGVVGARAGFSPGECLDFILGIFTLDFAKDDTKDKKKK